MTMVAKRPEIEKANENVLSAENSRLKTLLHQYFMNLECQVVIRRTGLYPRAAIRLSSSLIEDHSLASLSSMETGREPMGLAASCTLLLLDMFSRERRT